MGIVFATRGVLSARYSQGGATGLAFGNTAPASAVDAGALSGNSIQWAANNNVKGVSWPGRTNSPNGRAISVLCRIRPGYTGAPAVGQALWFLGTGGGKIMNLEINHNTAGNLIVQAKNELAAIVMNSVSAGAWSPTSGTWYDLVLTWDGTASASACSVYVDAALIGSITPTGALTSSWTNQYFTELALGAGNIGGSINAGRIDEFVIWDSVITPSSVTLETGTGSLNGAARTSLVSIAPGAASTGGTAPSKLGPAGLF